MNLYSWTKNLKAFPSPHHRSTIVLPGVSESLSCIRVISLSKLATYGTHLLRISDTTISVIYSNKIIIITKESSMSIHSKTGIICTNEVNHYSSYIQYTKNNNSFSLVSQKVKYILKEVSQNNPSYLVYTI